MLRIDYSTNAFMPLRRVTGRHSQNLVHLFERVHLPVSNPTVLQYHAKLRSIYRHRINHNGRECHRAIQELRGFRFDSFSDWLWLLADGRVTVRQHR